MIAKQSDNVHIWINLFKIKLPLNYASRFLISKVILKSMNSPSSCRSQSYVLEECGSSVISFRKWIFCPCVSGILSRNEASVKSLFFLAVSMHGNFLPFDYWRWFQIRNTESPPLLLTLRQPEKTALIRVWFRKIGLMFSCCTQARTVLIKTALTEDPLYLMNWSCCFQWVRKFK